MKKQFSKISLIFLICILFLAILIDSAGAQTPTATPPSPTVPPLPPTPTLSPTLVSPLLPDIDQLITSDIVSFSRLGQSEIQLEGPYDSSTIYFILPADWALKDTVQLDLLAGVSFNTDLQNQNDVAVVGGGTLTVLMNDIVLSAIPLNKTGETEIKINIPVSTILSKNGEISLQFILDSGASCRVIGLQTTVYIHPSSYLYLPHDIVQPPTSLLNFPRPIVQNSFFPDSVLLVIPDQPTAAELQAALTVAAGLKKLSWSQLIINMITVNKLQEVMTKQHLVFIGKASSLPLLGGINLPVPIINEQLQLSEGAPDDGLIGMVISPWSASHVALVVSANTDTGIIKAAQAVSSGVIRPNRSENFAVIEHINILPASRPQMVDQTLSDLGYEFRSFQRKGEARQEYLFHVPAGMTVSSEAYFDMIYGHSSLINYNTSQIVVLLNNQPIGSVRMSDATAAVPTNHAKIMIPPLAVLPGTNRLSMSVTLEPVDDCSPPSSQGLWVNIWPQSFIHLPLMDTSLTPLISRDLAAYPSPFIYNPTMENTAFVLEQNSLESWQNALKIALSLASNTSGALIQFSVFYGDEMPIKERSKYHLLVIGRPSQMPIVAEMNNDLPAPFLNDGDVISENGNFQVTYRIPPDSPMGYIETIHSPWNSENVVLAILGNTVQGVNWATAALVDLGWQLTGNFAVVNDKQIISSSTQYVGTDYSTILSTEIPSTANTPLSKTASDFPEARPMWILPAFIISVGLMAFVITMVTIRNQSRAKTSRQGKKIKENNIEDDVQTQS